MEILLLFLEKVCEALYFSLFLIFGKNIKEKRLLFISIMIFEYLALKCFIKYNIWFQIIYTFMSFVNLKILYKEKAQITDIFLFAIASIILTIISIISAFIAYYIINNYYVGLVINRIILFFIFYITKDSIPKFYKKFKYYWNRRKTNIRIKSLTLRNISIILFNFMFYILNICMAIALLTKVR